MRPPQSRHCPSSPGTTCLHKSTSSGSVQAHRATSCLCLGGIAMNQLFRPGELDNAGGGMVDGHGRAITYLRVSVTDRCDFRCVYCMAEDMTFLPKRDLLSIEELERLCDAFIAKGVKKMRLTGGEPLVRKGVMTLIENLGKRLNSGELEDWRHAVFAESMSPSIRSMMPSSGRSPGGVIWLRSRMASRPRRGRA